MAVVRVPWPDGVRTLVCAVVLAAPGPAAVRAEDTRAAAERAMTEAEALEKEGSAEANRRAVEKFEEAARLWRELGDRSGEAEALRATAMLLGRTDPDRALPLVERALALRRALADRSGEARALSTRGILHYYRGEQEKSLETQQAAAAIARELGDTHLEARAGNNIGLSWSALGEHVKALQQYDTVLALWRQLGDREQEARTLNNVGVVHWSLGELQEALAAWRQALPVRRALGDRRAIGITLHNLAMVYQTAGDFGRALAHYEEALELRRAVGDRRGEAKTLHNMAMALESVGEDARALEAYRRALALRREVGDRAGLALTLDSLGRIHQARGEVDQARAAFEESIDLARKAGDRRVEGFPLQGIALAHAARGETGQALATFEEALRLFRSVGDRPLEAEVLYQLATVRGTRGELDRARADAESAIRLLEDLRSAVAGDELRAAYVASNRSYYDLLVDVLMRLHARRPAEGFDALALAAAERGRARGLLDTLAEARAGIREGVEPRLLEAERDLRRRLGSRERQRMEALAGDGQAPPAALERELEALVAEYRDLQERLRVSSPRYADLTHPQPLSLPQIQRQVLDEDSLLLVYALGEARSFVWAVTRASLRSHELPGRAAIEDAARRYHQALTRSDRRVARGQAALAAAWLSGLVLQPVADLLGERRLLIVAEGALQYVPFGALPRPSGRPGGPPLIASQEVVHLPSASSVALLRQDVAQRPVAPKLVAVLSDPVFRADDPRVRTGSRPPAAPAPEAHADVARAAAESGMGALERLRFSRREADAIAALAPPGAFLKALDFEASRATAMRPSLADYRIVHFAAHGLVNSRHPELSGIALSLVDEQGQPQDGFLRLPDLYNLKLGADLVVLSACHTALGQEVKGEGLVGLTRGFFYAGAPRVVASLWSVRDEATALLMSRFYRALLEDGLSPSAALRSAQVSLWKEPRWRAPYYWAGFVLQGDWKPLP